MMPLIALALLVLAGFATGFAWQEVWGFYPLSPASWKWVLDYTRAYGHVPWFLLGSTFGALGGVMVAMVGIQAIAGRVRSRTTHGDHGADTMHGSAHFASKAEVKSANLWRPDGVVVGGWPTLTGVKPLRDEGPDNVLLIAPPRSGKGVGPILHTLLTWTESVVVHDIRGENYGKSAGWQAKRGAKVLKFDPTAIEGSVRWNPLAEVRMGTDYEVADAQNIAMMIIDPDGKGLADFWMKSGFAWLSAAILHCLYKVRADENRIATLADVGLLLSALEVGLEAVLEDMTQYDHGRPAVNDMVHIGAQEMQDRAAQERSGVHSSSKIDLTLYRDPIVARNISTSDFRLDDLQEADGPIALYLIVPPSDIDRLRPLLRVFWNLLLHRRMQTYDASGNATHKRQLLLMFDEFTSVKKLDIFEQSMAYMGGYGLKAFLVVQTLMQIEEVYGRNNSILGLSKLKAFYAPADVGTAKALSEMTGITTVVSQKHERSRGVLQVIGGNVSDRMEMTQRPLLTADECMRLRPAKKSRDGKKIVRAGEMLTIVTGHAPILGRQPIYFFNKTLRARAALPVPASNRPAAAGAAINEEETTEAALPPVPASGIADRIRAAARPQPIEGP